LTVNVKPGFASKNDLRLIACLADAVRLYRTVSSVALSWRRRASISLDGSRLCLEPSTFFAANRVANRMTLSAHDEISNHHDNDKNNKT